MHTRPFEASNPESSSQPSLQTSTSTQHGFQDRVCDGSGLSAPAAGLGASLNAGDGGSRRRGSFPGQTDAIESTPSHLSLDAPLVQDQASDRHSDGIDDGQESPWATCGNPASGFRVVSLPTRLADVRLKLNDFPNEVLTHMLSHLPPAGLSTMSLVSRHFHSLVTTPHAWRIAFSRFFPGPKAPTQLRRLDDPSSDSDNALVAGNRVFNRLTSFASWRSEYILRTRLLWCLSRGRPMDIAISSSPPGRASSQKAPHGYVTYNSGLIAPVTHIDAGFSPSLNKKTPKFIHGADDVGMASMSDPLRNKADAWGLTDTQVFAHSRLDFPAETEYGLGDGGMVVLPNALDVSRKFGMAYVEGIPGGRMYFKSVIEQRGHFLALSQREGSVKLGIPSLDHTKETQCCVWIAKKETIPQLSNGLVGILSGSSYGIVTAYSLGYDALSERRIDRGEKTARWVLSPGVPIIALAVDEEHSVQRCKQERLWAVALNALGEVFYLTNFPHRPESLGKQKLAAKDLDWLAWRTGRSVHWSLLEPSRRTATAKPYDSDTEGSRYPPRGSWDGQGLSRDQIAAETLEIEDLIKKKPKDIRSSYDGWDMRRNLEVDFASDDENDAGEGIVLFSCALEEGQKAQVVRFTRLKKPDFSLEYLKKEWSPTSAYQSHKAEGDFKEISKGKNAELSFATSIAGGASSPMEESQAHQGIESWSTSAFSFGASKAPQITCTALDVSKFALLTMGEDPLLGMSPSSNASSPLSSPSTLSPSIVKSSDIPGQRARFVAAGTSTGDVFVWNMRDPVSKNSETVNTIRPVAVIQTDSPQVSSLALSALYLVHGGIDGLVQAWDPLASTTQPIRTLSSRLSSRNRRRLAQTGDAGSSSFAAQAIWLDPDPSVLRGLVAIGTSVRFWSYSSEDADQYRSSKRRHRRSPRTSNHTSELARLRNRTALEDYIEEEKEALRTEMKQDQQRKALLTRRYGHGILGPGASDEDYLAYTAFLSKESAEEDEARRKSKNSQDSINTTSVGMRPGQLRETIDEDAELAEAISRSLEEQSYTASMINDAEPSSARSIYPADNGRMSSSSDPTAGEKLEQETLDLYYARKLQSESSEEEFPPLSSSSSSPRDSKGKRKAL